MILFIRLFKQTVKVTVKKDTAYTLQNCFLLQYNPYGRCCLYDKCQADPDAFMDTAKHNSPPV